MQENPESTIEEGQPGGAPTVDGVGADDLSALKTELNETKNRYMRVAADFQNFRKRAIEERALSVEIGRVQVALPMVDVLDDLRRSVEANGNSDDAFAQGVKLVYEKFVTELDKLGVRPMAVMGEQFDEERHEALMQRSAEGKAPGTILAEIQKGYTIDNKVLRHARVVVAK